MRSAKEAAVSAYAGVRIVDFSQGVAGPMAAMLLGDFESEVVKVEPPSGDPWRERPGYLAFNRNKQILTLDLEKPQDIAAARALLAGADVALFDRPPAGFEADALTAAHPGLIHVSMPPYGVTGPWSDLPARHVLLTALTGAAFRQGAYADQPVHLVLPLLWYGQAVMAAAAIGAALYERRRSGRGQAVTVNGLHGAAEVSGGVRLEGVPPLPRGEPLGSRPHYRLYRCGDGKWFFQATLFMNFFRRAFEAVGLGDKWEALKDDQPAATAALSARYAAMTRDEALAVLQAHDVPCGPVGRREDWFASDTVADAGLRQTFVHPELGEVAMPAPPAKLSATPAKVRGLPERIDRPPAWPPRQITPGGEAPAQPLAGVRVLNLGTVVAGAQAGVILSNLGAEVIKVEPPEADPYRSDAAAFLAYNRGPKGLGIDLKTPVGRDLFLELARTADVVIDNARLGVRRRLGIDYPALKTVNPRIISCSLNAYGETGPRAPLPGFDPLLQAEGGMMAAQGGADVDPAAEPILITIPVNDVASSGVIAMSVIAALNARDRTGEGQEILTSLAAQSLLFQLGECVDYAGRPPNEPGDRDCIGRTALHRFYACADGWLAIACETGAEAAGVGEALGLALPADALEAPRDGALARALEATFVVRPRTDSLAILRARGVPAAPVLRAAEALEDGWLAENRWLDSWTHPRLGTMTSARAFFDFSRTPAGFARPTPELGEHTRDVLADCWISPERVEALLAAGAVFEPRRAGQPMQTA